jgi:hypothetical protein
LVIGATTLLDFGAFTPDALVGLRVNPNVAQGSLATLTDDVSYVITANDSDSLTLAVGATDPAPTAVASAGDTYRGLLIVETLEIGGGAAVTSAGDILVLGGDLHSAAGAFDVPAGCSLAATILEVPAATQVTITGAITASQLFCSDCP